MLLQSSSHNHIVIGHRGRYFLPIPRRVPLLIVVGKAVGMPRLIQPTAEEIDYHHSRVVNEVRRIFETYKSGYGWQDKRLVVK